MQPIAAPAVLPVAIAVCDPGTSGVPPAPGGGQAPEDAASGEAGVFALLLPPAAPAPPPMLVEPDGSPAPPTTVDLAALLASPPEAAGTDDGQGADAELLALLASLTQASPTSPPTALATAPPTGAATAVAGAPATADAAYDALMTQLTAWTNEAGTDAAELPDLAQSLAGPTAPNAPTAWTASAATGGTPSPADPVPPTIAFPVPSPRRPGDVASAPVPMAEDSSTSAEVENAAVTAVPTLSAPAAAAAPAAPANRPPVAAPTGGSETAATEAILTAVAVAAPASAATTPVAEVAPLADATPTIRHASAPAPPPRPSAGPPAAPPAVAPDKPAAPAEQAATADTAAQTATGTLQSAQTPARIEQPAPAERTAPTPQPRSEANQLDRAVAQQVSRAIVQHLPDGGTRMVMRLTPPELGTVRIEFLTHDGATTARLLAEDEGVRQSLDRALPHIRADLRSEHPSLNITVERGEHNQHWSDGNARQDRRDQPHPGRQGQSGADAPVFAIDGIEPAPATIPARSERSLGGRLTSTSVDALA